MEQTSAVSSEKKIALFFFLIFLDDRIAARATARALDQLKKRNKSKSATSDVSEATLIEIATRVYQHVSRSFVPSTSSSTSEVWIIPKRIDMGPWRQFRKQVDTEDVMTVIWSQILEFSTEQISAGMGVSEGTVLYRVAAGLKSLGMMTPLGALRG